MQRGMSYTDGLKPPYVYEVAEIWDGTTFFIAPGTNHNYPSNSSSVHTKVCGPGTAWWLELTKEQVTFLFWRPERWTTKVVGSVTASTGISSRTATFPTTDYLGASRFATTNPAGLENSDRRTLLTGAEPRFEAWATLGLSVSSASTIPSYAPSVVGTYSAVSVNARVKTRGDSDELSLRYCKSTKKYYLSLGSMDIFLGGKKFQRALGPTVAAFYSWSEALIAALPDTAATNVWEQIDVWASEVAIPSGKYYVFEPGKSGAEGYFWGDLSNSSGTPIDGSPYASPYYDSTFFYETVDASVPITGTTITLFKGTHLETTQSLSRYAFFARRKVTSFRTYTPSGPVNTRWSGWANTFSNSECLTTVNIDIDVQISPYRYFEYGGMYDPITGEYVPVEPPPV
jgi:hypothetical protein